MNRGLCDQTGLWYRWVGPGDIWNGSNPGSLLNIRNDLLSEAMMHFVMCQADVR